MVMVLLVTVTSKPDSFASAVNGTFTERLRLLPAGSGRRRFTVGSNAI